jgi:hypothetical protein
MYLDDPYDFVRPGRPDPEPTSQERAEAARREAFAQEATHSGQYARPSAPETGYLQASAVCVISESGHVRVGRWCPHNLPKSQADYDQVEIVN